MSLSSPVPRLLALLNFFDAFIFIKAFFFLFFSWVVAAPFLELAFLSFLIAAASLAL